MCVNLTILEDEIVENNETFILTLTSAEQAILIGNRSTEVTILEDDDSMFLS